MASKRTVQFEFLVEADTRQIDRFHDTLKRLGQGTAVTENTLTSLREELQRFASISDKTENTMQGQIAALRDASRNAKLGGTEYGKLRAEMRMLSAEYERLTALESDALKNQRTVLGSDNAFQQRVADLKEQATAVKMNSAAYDKLQTQIKQLGTEYKRLQSLNSESLRGQATVLGSENAYKQRIASLREQASAVNMTEKEYKDLREELVRVEAQYRKLSGAEASGIRPGDNRRQERRRMLRDLGQTASQIGIGGFFAGPEGLLGSTAGAVIGTAIPGAGTAAGAAIGASVGLGLQSIRQQAAGVATLNAELNLAKTTLAQVSKNQDEYNQKLQFARQVSTDYSVGLQATIEGYAKVTAAATANGLTLKETETIYKGMLASGVAFGASQQDLESIILATTQVLSKGRVSMEEISQQIGERIPGAVARFAQLTGRSLAELAKDFEQGKVNMADFVKFAEGQFNDYDAAAQVIGSSPEKAGERLKLALTEMNEAYGGFFQKTGAGFQDLGTQIANWTTSQIDNFKTLVGTIAWYKNNVVGFFSSIKQGLENTGPAISRELSYLNNPLSPPPRQQFGPPAPQPPPRDNFFTNFLRDRRNEADALFPGFVQPRFGGGATGQRAPDTAAAETGKAAEKAASAAKTAADKETALREQRRREELLADNAIRLADRVFQHQQDLIRKRYDLENSLIEATRRAQEAALIGPAREALSLTNRMAAIIEERDRQIRDGRLEVEAQQQAVRSAQASAVNRSRYAEVPGSEVGGGAGFRGGAQTGWTRDRDAEQSGFDVVLPGGAGGRVPSPVSQLKITGVGFQGKGSGASGRGYGNYVSGEFVGIDGKKYEMLLGHFNKVEVRVGDILSKGDTIGQQGETGRTFGAHVTTHVNALNGGDPWRTLKDEVVTPWVKGWGGTRTQPGVASGLTRMTTDLGGVQLSEADLKNAQEQQRLSEANVNQVAQQRLITEILGSTEAYRTQTQTIKDQYQELKERNRLQMEGVKPEVIDQQMRLNESTLIYNRNLDELQKQLVNINKEKDPELYAAQTAAIDRLNESYNDQITALQALNALENDPSAKMQKRVGDLKLQLSELQDGQNQIISLSSTIETSVAQAMSSAVSSVTTGAGSVQDAVVNMLQQIATAIIDTISQIVAKQAALSFLNLIGGGIRLPGAGGGGLGIEGIGGADFLKYAGPFANAKGGVMTENGPLKALPYARGGIASTPQVAVFGEGSMPEAYVPLPDGRRIPVNMQLPFQQRGGGAEAMGGLTLPYAKGGAMDAAEAANDKPLQIEYRRVGAGDLPFVTEEQHRRGMEQAAQAGEARTLRRLRTSPAARRRAGV